MVDHLNRVGVSLVDFYSQTGDGPREERRSVFHELDFLLLSGEHIKEWCLVESLLTPSRSKLDRDVKLVAEISCVSDVACCTINFDAGNVSLIWIVLVVMFKLPVVDGACLGLC